MTRDEFEAYCARNCGKTVEWLRAFNAEVGHDIRPCDCGEEGCQGWQMVNVALYEEDQRLLRAIALYQEWFWAPQCTPQHAVERLDALGFTWDDGHWTPPSVEVFVQRMMGGTDWTLRKAAEYVRGIST